MLTEAEILRFGVQCQFEKHTKEIHSTLPLLSSLCALICEKLRPDLNVLDELFLTTESLFTSKKEQIHAKLQNGDWRGEGKHWRIQRIPYQSMFPGYSFLVREIRVDTLAFFRLLIGENPMVESKLSLHERGFCSLHELLEGLTEELVKSKK
jgi:hypothetical protein